MRSKILYVSSLALLSVVLLSGTACRSGYPPAPAPAPAPLPEPEPLPPPTDTGSMSTSDSALHDRVHQALADAPDVDATDIGVRVENGNVYLSGTVPTAEQREIAHNIAHAVDGVQRVFYADLRVR